MSQETCIEEIMEKEMKNEMEFWFKLYRTSQKEKLDLQVKVHKMEMILEVLARHNQLPDLAYELVPSLQKTSSRVIWKSTLKPVTSVGLKSG